VGAATDASVLRAATASIDAAEVARLQRDVMSGIVVPEY
jgi:hypothetical protein